MRWFLTKVYRTAALSLGCAIFSLMPSSSAWAGNVQVLFEGSLLKVVGSSTADVIALAQSANGDIFVSAGAGTTVGGRASQVLRRVSINAVEVRMEGGNDAVSIRGFRVANDCYVNLGAGNDRFSTSGPITVGANLTIEGEGGNDVVRLTDADVGQDLYVSGGIGSLNSNMVGLQIGKSLTIIGDDAADQIVVDQTLVFETIAVETKSGNDRIGISAGIAFGLVVSTDAGADVVDISDFMAEEAIGVFTGVGNDAVNLRNVVANTTLSVSVDAGDDLVTGQAVSAGTDAVFEGGDGTDSLVDQGITGGIKKEIKEFENVTP